ncbi:hypothetical protein H4R21_004121 [Coemansia helicoidea]|uniref:Uncharacterized protein n=1 Tax=Coemansia helicoidea TaxID=1286919 RepID=A0ACC1KZN3_9FUNG|nr:hypothetical protein H4R21_004121 [Coemansia helicoidea]
MSDDSQGLSQADFRKMLQTPRAPAGGGGSQGVLGKRRPPPRPQPPAPSRPPKRATHSASDSSKYRDRAAERRRGAGDGTAEAAPADTGALSGSIGMSAEHHAQYERSKYLGGSVDRTHLVKGLDYLLLEKTRSQSAAGDGGHGDLDLELERLQAGCASPRSEAAVLEDPPRTALGKCVAGALQQIQSGTAHLAKMMADPAAHVECKGDLFRPRRMYFELTPAALLGATAPTARIRGQDPSRAAAPGGGTLDGEGDSLVVAKVAAAIARRRAAETSNASDAGETGDAPGPGNTDAHEDATGAGPTTAALPAAGPGSAQAHVEENDGGGDDDDDIFADAGIDYSVTVTVGRESGTDTTAPPDYGDAAEQVVIAPYPDSDQDGDDGFVAAPYPDSDQDGDGGFVAEPYPESHSEDD